MGESSDFRFIAILVGLVAVGGAVGLLAGGGLGGGEGESQVGQPEQEIVEPEPPVEGGQGEPIEGEPETGGEESQQGGGESGGESQQGEPSGEPSKEESGSESGESEQGEPEEEDLVNITILPTGTKATFKNGGKTKVCVGGESCELAAGKTYDYQAEKELFVSEGGKVTISKNKTVAVCLNLDWEPYGQEDFNKLAKVKGSCSNGKGNDIYNILNEVYNTQEADEEGDIWE